MPRLGTACFEGYSSLEEVCRQVRAAGFDSVELHGGQFLRRLTTTATRKAFASWTKRQRLSMYGLAADLPVQPFGARSATLERFRAAIDFAAELDLGLVITHDGLRQDLGHRRRSQCLPGLVKYFQRLADLAQRRGLEIAIEPRPDTLSMDAAFAIDLFDAIDRENVGLLYDCCHYGVGHSHSYARLIEKLGVRIRHVHLCDSDCRTYGLHLPPGEGSLDLKRIVRALKDVRFRGSLSGSLANYPLPEDGSRRLCESIAAAEADLGLTAER